MPSWTVDWDAPVMLMNKSSREHWTQRAEQTSTWRNAGYYIAKQAKIPKALGPADISVVHRYKTTGRRPDLGACFPSVKAVIDGFVDAGLWADDGPDYVRSLCFLPIMGGLIEGLTVIIYCPESDNIDNA